MKKHLYPLNNRLKIMLILMGIGLAIWGFIICWPAALLVFIFCWIDNIRKGNVKGEYDPK